MKVMKLILKAPLQSWGENARWDNRDTALMPTKSAVIGILGNCLGYPRGDERLCRLSRALHLAVRADCPGMIMRDYHTVQGTGGKFINASGGRRPGGTIVTPRQYLQDAVFSIFLWGDEDVLNLCGQALLHPHWPAFLGRRSCVPAVPLIPAWLEEKNIDAAVCKILPEEEKYCNQTMTVQAQIEMLPGETVQEDQQVIERKDEVICAGSNEYQTRRVRILRLVKEGRGYVSK